jgi:hypothetical protein
MTRLIVAATCLAALAGLGLGSSGRSGGPIHVDLRAVPGSGEYSEGAIWHLRVRRYRGAEQVVDRRITRPGGVTLSLPVGAYLLLSSQLPCDGDCTNLDPETDRCDVPFVIFGRSRIAAVVHLRPGAGCRVTVDNTPATARTRVVAPRRAPRWLRRLAFVEASRLEDPRPREIRLALGRKDTIVLRGRFVCPTCYGSPGSLPRGTVARFTVDPRTHGIVSFGLR